MLWRKPNDLKYTDLCIFIDSHIVDIINPGEHPDIENQVRNYLYLVIKSLSIKKRMFKNFQDYDAFSFYAANRIFFAIRKNYWNQGKVIKGKLIRPIKSCLNYIKALMYPMKVEYQNETFKETMSEEFLAQKLGAAANNTAYYSGIKTSEGVTENFIMYLESTFNNIGVILDRVLKNSPFAPATSDYKHIKISLFLNTIKIIEQKHRLDPEVSPVILWKLPKSMSNYIKILLKEFFLEIKKEMLDCYRAVDMDEATVRSIIQSTSQEITTYGEQDD